MKRTIAFLFAMAFIACVNMQNATAQVTTNGGSGLATNYSTLADAITALNAASITAPVVITLSGNETAPAGGYSLNQLGGTAVNTITIQGSGSTITAGLQSAGSITDAVFKIIGGDYITIQNFTMQENAGNSVNTLASNTMTEFGVALFAATATNGAQNNTIQNNTIALNSDYQNAIGVFSTSSSSSTNGVLAATSTAGTNSNNKFYGNTISGVAYGMYFICPANTASLFETGIDIGGTSSATGNTITFGNATQTNFTWTNFNGSVPAGIYFRNGGVGCNVSYNSITSNDLQYVQTNGLGGIVSAGTAPTGVSYASARSNNMIVLNTRATFIINGIDFGFGLNTGSIACNGNTITINQALTASSSQAVNGIKAAYPSSTNTCNGNSITINQSETSGGLSSPTIGIEMSSIGTTLNAHSNTIIVNQTISSTTACSTPITGIKAASASTNVNIGSIGNANTITIKQDVSGSGTYGSGEIKFIDAGGLVSQGSINIQYNNLNTSGSLLRTTGATYGIYNISTISTSLNVDNNIVNIDRSGSTAISGDFVGLYIGSGSNSGASNYSISSNSITLNSISSGTTYAIRNNDGNVNKNINNNTININGSAKTINGMSFDRGINNIGAAGLGNTFSLSSSVVTPTIIGINTTANDLSIVFNIKYNTFNSISASAAGANAPVISVIKINSGSSYAPVSNISNNLIYGVSTGAGSGSATINGIEIASGTINWGANNIFRNKIYDLSTACTGTSTVITPILIARGSTNNIYNNVIGLTNSFTGVNSVEAIRAINISSVVSSSTHNVYYNTIYLNATSTGANFGTIGIRAYTSATSTTSKLDLRNNIIVNTSTPNGTGKTIAYKRGYPDLANYASTSNNNLFYAGTPSANNLVFTDGTNSDQTLSAYKTRVSSRDNASITENPTWLSTTGLDADFLHINTSVATLIESAGANIATYTDDFDGDVRQGNAGYAGTGTAPDMGADEFSPSGCIGAVGGTTVGSTSFCVSGTPSISATGYSVGAGSTYQWQSSDDIAFTTPVDISGQTNPAALTVGVVSATTYYRLRVSCSAGLATDYSTVATVAINPVPTASASSNTGICAGLTLNLTGTTDIGTSFSWTGPNGFISTDQNPTIPSATTAASGTYLFTATANGCSSTTSSTLVSINPTPSAILITPAMPNVCEGEVQQMVANGGAFSGIIGSGATTASASDNPFYGYFGNNQQQILVKASELIAAGVPAGDLSSLSLYVTSGTQNMPDFNLSIAPTALTAMSSIVTSGFTTVYSNLTGVTSTVGVNTIVFDTPFAWDGTSNLILKFCWGNNTNSATINNTLLADPTTYVSSLNTYTPYITSGSNVCTRTTVSSSYSKRPKLSFGFGNHVTWAPITDLYTDANATIPYVANTVTKTVYSKPTAIATVYTATVAPSNGCNSTGSTTVTQTTATMSYNGSPFCHSISVPQAAILNGTGAYTGGVYTASPAGLAINSTTGAITPSTSLGGTYTVSYAIPNCETITTSITITSATITYAGTPFCSSLSTPQTVALNGAGDYSGGGYSASPAGLTIDPTTGTIVPSTSLPGTYTVSYAIPNCETVTTSVSITTATIAYAGTPFCSSISTPRTVTLNGTGAYTGGVYSASPAGLTINPATGSITPNTSIGATYTVSYAIPNCETVTTSVAITSATIAYAGNPFCSSVSTPQTATLNGTGAYTGGVYSASPTGLMINPTTGTITPSTSLGGTYTVSYTISNCQAFTTSVTITTRPTASISYPGSPYQTSLGDQAVNFSGTTGGIYSTIPTGLSINASTGLVTPSTSLLNTYIITYTIAAAGGCGVVTDTANVAIIAATCPAPTALAVSAINAAGASLNWTAGGTETAWNIRFKKVADASYTNVNNTTTKPYLLTGLQATTAYVWNVQAVCSGTLSSVWSDQNTFTTTVGVENSSLSGMSVYSYNNQINVINNGNVPVKAVVIYDMIGQEVGFYPINSTDNVLINAGLTIGNYVVKVIADKKVGTYKLFIK